MAGSWTTTAVWKKAQLETSMRGIRGLEYEFTADAAAASIPNKATEAVAGAIVDLRVKFDATTPPDALTVQVLDADGVEVFPETAFTASGYANLGETRWFVPGTLTIVCTGNTTNSAKAKVTLVIA